MKQKFSEKSTRVLLGVLLGFCLEWASLLLVPASELLAFLSSVPLSGLCSEDLGLEACLTCCWHRCNRRLTVSDGKIGSLLKGLGPAAEQPSTAALAGAHFEPQLVHRVLELAIMLLESAAVCQCIAVRSYPR